MKCRTTRCSTRGTSRSAAGRARSRWATAATSAPGAGAGARRSAASTPSCSAKNERMIVAHFSDVHALSLAGATPLSFLNKRLAGGLNLLLKRRNKHPVALFEQLVDELNRVRPD